MLTESGWPLVCGIIVLATFIGIAMTEQMLTSLKELDNDERDRSN